jgi:putative PIN family toxin of toxin-antitoxin system
MASELRVVFDTTVVVSALLVPKSTPRRAFDSAMATGRLLVSAATIAELDEVLRRPKFDKFVAEDRRLEFLAAIVTAADVVEIVESIRECRDPKDDKFLELAASGSASHLVTGDADLLILNPFRGTAFISSADFLSATSFAPGS